MARPVWVSPMTFASFHRKCCHHRSSRGLNNATTVPLAGSIPVRFGPFRELQCRQASARLLMTVLPPCCLGRTWSTCAGVAVAASGTRQYSHRYPARRRTWSRRRRVMKPCDAQNAVSWTCVQQASVALSSAAASAYDRSVHNPPAPTAAFQSAFRCSIEPPTAACASNLATRIAYPGRLSPALSATSNALVRLRVAKSFLVSIRS